jgi:hypothetical protein
VGGGSKVKGKGLGRRVLRCSRGFDGGKKVEGKWVSKRVEGGWVSAPALARAVGSRAGGGWEWREVRKGRFRERVLGSVWRLRGWKEGGYPHLLLLMLQGLDGEGACLRVEGGEERAVLGKGY